MTKYVIVEVRECGYADDYSWEPEDCQALNKEDRCLGCMFNGFRFAPGTDRPARPIQGGGCRGGEWQELRRHPRDR